eukprot:1556792-Pyramimonas_sp.AAC.1
MTSTTAGYSSKIYSIIGRLKAMRAGMNATCELPGGAFATATGPIRHWRRWTSADCLTTQACRGTGS